MESINELRNICQKSRLWADTWHGKHICRPLSIYLTRLAIMAGLTANQVTVLFFLMGLLACTLFLDGGPVFNFYGCIALQLWYLLDHVDGEVARYRKKTSLAGIYMDEMVHYTVHPLVFLSLGYGQFILYGRLSYILISIPAALAMIYIPLSQVLKETIFKAGEENKIHGLHADNPDRNNILLFIFSLVHKSCTFPALMDILTIIAVLSLIPGLNLIPAFLIYCAVAGTLVWGAKVVFIIMRNR
jgi:phosphatidylglycerophosphate synthase